MSFGAQSALSASVAQRTVKAAYVNGWANFRYSNIRASGLPVMGVSFIKLSNPNASSGVSANYGIAWPHVLER
jgi:hypothetical protein